MDRREIKMGKLVDSFNEGNYQSITFCVTEECNLRCKYCYMIHKNSFRRMSLDVAKQAVDYFLAQPVEMDAVAWEFIGGEPLLEIDMINDLCNYIKREMFRLDHPWFKKYMFSFSSNGLLFNSEAVQDYIKRNKNHISFGITIDGTKEKHDLQRVFPNGQGSYESIIENVKLWMRQFPGASTKVTFASDDLKYLKESVIHLWNLGLKGIPANVVFEDVWKDGDELIFEEQLRELADYILDNELWWDYSVRFFDPTIGIPLGHNDLQTNFCGSGRMTAIDCDGKFYPCIRFLDFCLPSKNIHPITKGNIHQGIDNSVVDTFKKLTIELVSDDECKSCPIAYGCFACAGNNYCYTESNTIFKRTKFHCAMYKAQVKVNDYFWNELGKRLHFPTPHEQCKMRTYRNTNYWNIPSARFLYIILQDNIIPHCQYQALSRSNGSISKELLAQAFDYARNNHLVPVILGDELNYLTEHQKNIFHISMPCSQIDEVIFSASDVTEVIPIFNRITYSKISHQLEACILSIDQHSITMLSDIIGHLSNYARRINIIPNDYLTWTEPEINKYTAQLALIKQNYDAQEYGDISINLFEQKSMFSSCHAGTNQITLAPDGRFYICPAFYFNGLQPVGNIKHGYVIPDVDQYSVEKAPYCRSCNNTSCLRCHYLNIINTGHVNIPPQDLCHIHEIETNVCSTLEREASIYG